MNLNQIITAIEKRMVNPTPTQKAERPYFAGYIDAMFDTQFITRDQQMGLHMQYAEPDMLDRLAKALRKP